MRGNIRRRVKDALKERGRGREVTERGDKGRRRMLEKGRGVRWTKKLTDKETDR